jgi:serine/threonine protein kinase
MSKHLAVSVGQFSDKGRKALNQDFHGVMLPNEPQLLTKGIVAAIADGISSSEYSHIASESSVRSLLEDYYCTSETWSVKKSVMCVLNANNSWLYSQTVKNGYKYDKNKGYVNTLSALIIKSNTAYTFHIGDSRIYHFRNGTGSLITQDHRTWVSKEQSYLSRAMGMFPQLEIDNDAITLEKGDIFVLATDGVYEQIDMDVMHTLITDSLTDLDQVAADMVHYASEQGSNDNLSVQIIRIDKLPSQEASERLQQLIMLPFPPVLAERSEFDGFKILRILYASSRSHVYLAKDLHCPDSPPVVIKAPSIELREDPAHLERFLTEEWIARRINNAHVLKPCEVTRKRNYLYTVFEFIEGQTLTQWMHDNPNPNMQSVREIVEQIAKGLMSFHRLEMLHQDLRPENIMIDSYGVVKIIDFGSTKVAGLAEMSKPIDQEPILGTLQYTAPEYFLGEAGAPRSDLFSLAVVTYQMLSGSLPYGTKVSAARTITAQNKLLYHSVLHDDKEIPVWVDDTLKRALHVNPLKRYQELSEFMFDLKQPSKAFLRKVRPPLIERDPVMFWQGVSLSLVLIILYLIAN